MLPISEGRSAMSGNPARSTRSKTGRASLTTAAS
jgi:hypothetical protein